ncbi:MAG: hypothetical protein R2726_20525 [Acidimicrobiales bacterium]
MGHMQLSHTKIVPEAWQDLTPEQNDAQSAAIYEVIGRNGGDVKVVGWLPSNISLVSVIEYPDETAAKRSVAEIVALGTLEFTSIQNIWDVGEWTQMLRAANGG